MLFLSFLDYLLKDAYIIFQKGVDNFDQVQNMVILGLGCSSPLIQLISIKVYHFPQPLKIASLDACSSWAAGWKALPVRMLNLILSINTYDN